MAGRVEGIHGGGAQALPTGSAAATSEPLRALLVDDDAQFGDTIVRALALHGIRAQHVATLASAHRALATATFDVAIVDLSLPDGDGASLLPLLKQNKVAAIVLSGHYISDRAAEIAAWGAFPVPKPTCTSALAGLIRTLLGRERRNAAMFAEIHGISTNEMAVIVWAARGLDAKETAERLDCGLPTINEYWLRIYRKLGLKGRYAVLAAYQSFLRQ